MPAPPLGRPAYWQAGFRTFGWVDLIKLKSRWANHAAN